MSNNYMIDTRPPYQRLGISKEKYLKIFDKFLQKPTHIKIICKKFKIDRKTVYAYAKLFNKEYLLFDVTREFWRSKCKDKNSAIKLLRQLLLNDYSLPKLAIYFNCSATAIFNFMKKNKIQKRRKELRNKKYLEKYYLEEKLSAEEIGHRLGVTAEAVKWYLNKFKIKRRTLKEVQKLAQIKRTKTIYNVLNQKTSKDYYSRGYCVRYKHFYCRSLNELIWLLKNENKYKQIKAEPFIIENYKPDFLINESIVIEVKGRKRDLKKEELQRYQYLGRQIKKRLGYSFQLVFISDEYSDFYKEIRQKVIDLGGKPGLTITWPK